MTARTLHLIVNEWQRASREAKADRLRFGFIRFAAKKRKNYGWIYQAFLSWHRFTAWKKIAKKSRVGVVTLAEQELNIPWKVLEMSRNGKRALVIRANEVSRRRIASKTSRALYNLSVMRGADQAVMEEADRFRVRRLHVLAHRAWLRYMQIHMKDNQFLRDIVRGWYLRVYRTRKWKFTVALAEKLNLQSHIRLILNQWYKHGRAMKLRRLRAEMHLHRNAAMATAMIFFLRGDFEMFFSAFCFRIWLRFAKARKRWKEFAVWSENSDLNAELSHCVLCELKRAALLKVTQRMYTSKPRFFPRRVGFSMEMTVKVVREIRENEKKEEGWRWKFETAGPEGRRAVPDFRELSLVRCLVLAVHRIKNFDLGYFVHGQSRFSGNPFFERLRTLPEIVDQSEANIDLFRQRLSRRNRRDGAVLAGMCSHLSAVRLGDFYAQFRTDDNCTIIVFVPDPGEGDPQEMKRVYVFPDLDESIEVLLRDNFGAQPRLKGSTAETKDRELREFHGHLRNPYESEQEQYTGFKTGRIVSEASSLPNQNPLSASASIRSIKACKSRLAGLLAGQGNFESPAELFTIEHLSSILKNFVGMDDMILAFQKALLDVCGVSLDVSVQLSIGKASMIAEGAEQTRRHRMVRNIAAFVAEYVGISDLKNVPLKVKAPSDIINAVNAALTIHRAVQSTPLAQYCNDCPFSTRLRFDDALVQEARDRIWQAFRQRFPRLDSQLAGFHSVSVMARLKSVAASMMALAGGGSEEALTAKEVALVAFMLPFVLDFDSVIDFVKDEILAKIGRKRVE
jgi:hypothetical protein